MYEDEDRIRRIPGFVFVSLADAMKYSKDFEHWCYRHGTADKNLYTFTGVDPTPIKQSLTSHFGHRTPPYPITDLTPKQVEEALAYFDTKPFDHFTYRVGVEDIPLMLSVAKAVGCIKNKTSEAGYVYSVEAFYFLPATMERMSPQDMLACSIED